MRGGDGARVRPMVRGCDGAGSSGARRVGLLILAPGEPVEQCTTETTRRMMPMNISALVVIPLPQSAA